MTLYFYKKRAKPKTKIRQGDSELEWYWPRISIPALNLKIEGYCCLCDLSYIVDSILTAIDTFMIFE